MAELSLYQTQGQATASTVASQQYYHNPVGFGQIETGTVTVGSIAYPLRPIDSQLTWDQMNQTLISTSAIPQFFFQRRDDWGIWPIPQAVYTITLNYTLRDRNLVTADYTTGTVTVTNNSQTLTGSGTTFTTAMIGRWFATDNDRYWYRISGYTSATVLTLETSFEGTTGASQTYRIGESPEIPEEGHELLSTGPTADWYAGPRGDITKATWWNNVFWTGDGNNNDRTSRDIKGGLIGLKRRYDTRSNSGIVRRKPYRGNVNDKLFATVIS